MSWSREHVWDPADFCDAKVLLDEFEVLVSSSCAGCLLPLTECVCAWERPPDGYRMPRPFGAGFEGHVTRPAPEVER